MITKKDTIAQTIHKDEKAGEILFNEGLMCAGCGMAHYETIDQGCRVHGLNINKILKKLNKPLSKKIKKPAKTKKKR